MKTDLVIAGFLIHDNKVLLIHHKKLDLWLPVGGHIDADEIPDDALKREFKEEVNLDVEILNKKDIPDGGNIKRQLAVPFYVNVHSVGDHDHCCLYYLCKLKSPEGLKINESELKDAKWFSIEELEQEHIPADTKNIALRAFKLFTSIEKE